MKRAAIQAIALVVATAATAIVRAHNGPPFPILSDRIAGGYRISIWTDPDTTDDGSLGGQFWVRLEPSSGTGVIPEPTRVTVSIKPVDRAGAGLSTAAAPVRGEAGNQFAGLLMDHEGRFAVHVVVDGPLGAAAVDAEVDATYDLRPAAYMLVLYAAPFVLMGLLWGRLLIRRGRSR